MKSLAVKYRPKTFEDVCGQTITVEILSKVISTRNPKNAYLLCGESGCGKTTLARIFANELNNHQGMPIEIDAASNNGVDQVRTIIDSARQRSLDSEYKVFIIDEAHAITSAGWQAFLKGIEEPSPYTIFIFCTTEPHKIPTTILNRVQRYNIAKIPSKEIKERLLYISKQENFTNPEDTCELISKLCNGCMRDAIMTLDQCADLSADLSLQNTKAILGEAPYERMLKLTNCLLSKNAQYTLIALETLANEGRDFKNFTDNYLEFLLDLTKYVLFRDINLTLIPSYLEDSENKMISVKAILSYPEVFKKLRILCDALLELKSIIRYDTSIKATVEAYFLKMCDML